MVNVNTLCVCVCVDLSALLRQLSSLPLTKIEEEGGRGGEEEGETGGREGEGMCVFALCLTGRTGLINFIRTHVTSS